MIKFSSSAIYFLIMLILLAVSMPADAQKKKKKRKKNNSTEVVSDFSLHSGKEPTEKEIRESEVYFIEGEKYFLLENYAKAYVLYQRSLDLNPVSGAINYRIAELLIKTEEFDKALIYITRAIDLSPENKYYYLLQAEVYTKKGNLAKASEVYEKLTSTIPGTEQYLFDLAALYLYQNKLSMALAAYQRAEKSYGVLPEIVEQKQKIYLKQNNLEHAILEGEKLIEAFPGESLYVNELAEMLMANSQQDRAIKLLNEYISTYPNNAQSELLLATVYHTNGQLEKASPYFISAFENPELDLQVKLQTQASLIKKLPNKDIENLVVPLGEAIIETHPLSSEAYAINGDLQFALQDKNKAVKYYKQAAKLDGSNFNIWQNILQIEYEHEAWDSVIYYSDKAMELYPNQSAVYFYNGSAQLIRKNYEEAAYALEQGASLSMSNEELQVLFLSQLGDAYNGLEKFEKSDQAYEDVLKVDPENVYVLNNYSYYLSLRKANLQKALKMSSKLVDIHPDNANYLDTYAWVLYNMGDYEKALTYLEKAIEHNPNGTIIEHYGDVLFKLGKVEEAVDQWQEAKGMDSTSDLIDKKIANKQLYE